MLWSYSLHCLNMFHIFLLPFIVYQCHSIHSIPGPLQCNSYIADAGKHSSKQVSERVCFQISRVVLLRTCFQFLRREGWKPHITVHSFISLMISRGVAWNEPQSLCMILREGNEESHQWLIPSTPPFLFWSDFPSRFLIVWIDCWSIFTHVKLVQL